ncbi:MAG TPA: ABC transporter substrate-binding protein [Polyangium sp.]|nr:ABC transporter substrate-binding protein [Polyangium sp.]
MDRRNVLRAALGAGIWASVAPLAAMSGCKRGVVTGPPLRLGLSDWPGHAPFYGAQKLGMFAPATVEIKSFSSNFDRNRAFAKKNLDALATPLFDALKIADGGADLKIVLLFDYSAGGDGIVGAQGIGGISDLRGKRVSAELGAITHFVLLSALKTAGLRENDVQIVNLSVPEGVEAFKTGKVDAATVWDPHLSRLAALPGARKIFTSKDIPGQVIDVLIVQNELAKSRPQDVEALLRGWERSMRLWREKPADHEALMATQMPGRTAASLHEDFQGLELLDLAANARLFKDGSNGPSARRSFEETSAFMTQAKLFEERPRVASELLDPQFMEHVLADKV